jgi:hypothetical protein
MSDSTLEEVKKRHFEYSSEEINARFVDHWEFADDFITGFLAEKEKTPSFKSM